MKPKEGFVLSEIGIMVLVSGSGTNLQALLNAEKKGSYNGKISLVVSDRPGVYALTRAMDAGIPAIVEEPNKNLPVQIRREDLSDRILSRAESGGISLIVLAGFLSILAGNIIQRYSGRIINLHPSLLPKYGGNGMYGEKVHRAVLENGETESGCTVHLVDCGTDTGPILLQRKTPVFKDDTPETLARRIHEEEHTAIVEAVRIMAGRLS